MRFPHSDNNWDLRLGRLQCFGSNICIFEIDLLTVLYEFSITDRFFFFGVGYRCCWMSGAHAFTRT